VLTEERETAGQLRFLSKQKRTPANSVFPPKFIRWWFDQCESKYDPSLHALETAAEMYVAIMHEYAQHTPVDQ